MIKNRTLLAASFAALVLGSVPAFAGERQGDPFSASYSGFAASAGFRSVAADVGNEQQIVPAGRPGTGLRLSAELLPANGQNAVVQTANSAPAGFEDSTVQSIQARRVEAWQRSHLRPTPVLATRRAATAPQG